MVYKKILSHLKANKHVMYVFKRANNKPRMAIISNGDKELVKTIVEIDLNTIQGNKVTKAHLKYLNEYINALHCSKRTLNLN